MAAQLPLHQSNAQCCTNPPVHLTLAIIHEEDPEKNPEGETHRVFQTNIMNWQTNFISSESCLASDAKNIRTIKNPEASCVTVLTSRLHVTLLVFVHIWQQTCQHIRFHL